MDNPHPVVHGYYRWADIFHQWAYAFSTESHIRTALKALLAPNALTHEDHPLRSHELGGIELWIGTFRNGKLQLLFSSAQVEYIRYWIQAMGLSEGLSIAIPDSSFLLLPGKQLRSVSPAIYSNSKAIKHAQKTIDKTNRRLISPTEQLLMLRSNFEKIRNCWFRKIGTWCAIDFETWERDHQVVTEFGMSSLSWEGDRENISDAHMVVKENKKFTNSLFVQGNRDHFLFGNSQDFPLREVKERVCRIISSLKENGPLFLLFHTKAEDVRVLRSWGAPVEGAKSDIPDELAIEGVFLVDTVDLFAALSGQVKVRRSLERMCRLLDIPDLDRFHNAGNDARFTLMAVRSMAGGMPLDNQRELRWPNQTKPSIEVEWKPWQEESDFSDTEGIFDPHNLNGIHIGAGGGAPVDINEIDLNEDHSM